MERGRRAGEEQRGERERGRCTIWLSSEREGVIDILDVDSGVDGHRVDVDCEWLEQHQLRYSCIYFFQIIFLLVPFLSSLTLLFF